MGRLILIAIVALAIAFVVISVMSLLKPAPEAGRTNKGDTMPDTMKTVAYVLLIALMFGVASGWLAG